MSMSLPVIFMRPAIDTTHSRSNNFTWHCIIWITLLFQFQLLQLILQWIFGLWLKFSELLPLLDPQPLLNTLCPFIFICILPQFNFSSVVPGQLNGKLSPILHDSKQAIISVSVHIFVLTSGRCDVPLFSDMVN